jgi:hypothetical protein
MDFIEQRVSKADAVDELKHQISSLAHKFDRAALDQGGILPKPETAAATPPAGKPVVSPTGHRVDNQFRETGFRSVLAYTQLPGKGTFSDSTNVPSYDLPKFTSHRFAGSSGPATGSSSGQWPKIPFPRFDGENPKLWQSRCETYFDMCAVDRSNWVRIASMYFDKAAARWLQSVEDRAKFMDWSLFCKLVHDRFGRDQHELLIRQLFHIKQTGTVAEYVEDFAQLVDQLFAYTSTTDPLYYTLRFIDGLRDDIKSIVLVQRPQDLDTACVLASLQEEVEDTHRRRDFRWLEAGFHSKPPYKSPLPLPAPPRDKHHAQSTAVDTRGVEAARASNSVDSKAAALHTYRRAMGLCYKCSERWSKDHKCSPTVQLQVVQEMWDLFQLDDESLSPTGSSEGSQLFLAISQAASKGCVAPKTVQFSGSIQHIQISLLVDSGSSASFISAQLDSQLSGAVSLSKDIKVQVAVAVS